jgi:hypothetical protein
MQFRHLPPNEARLLVVAPRLREAREETVAAGSDAITNTIGTGGFSQSSPIRKAYQQADVTRSQGLLAKGHQRPGPIEPKPFGVSGHHLAVSTVSSRPTRITSDPADDRRRAQLLSPGGPLQPEFTFPQNLNCDGMASLCLLSCFTKIVPTSIVFG